MRRYTNPRLPYLTLPYVTLQVQSTTVAGKTPLRNVDLLRVEWDVKLSGVTRVGDNVPLDP